MPRRSAGFIAKRPHKKSRRGCSTCKKKKVKCDEGQPSCKYCSLRKLECVYPTEAQKEPDTSSSDTSPDWEHDLFDFSEPVDMPMWLTPAVITSSGQLNATELKYLHHYTTIVWKSMSLQQNDNVAFINRDWVPRSCMASEHMLHSILSISAGHLHAHSPSKTSSDQTLSLVYRQRAFSSYNKQLANITSENYESLLITSMWMMVMVPPPSLPCSDDACLTWASSLFTMMQGLRILASLRWASGIERLTIYPLFRRELKKLPPPPMLTPLPAWFFYTGTQQPAEWRSPNSPNDHYSDADSTSPPPRRSPSPTPLKSAGVQIDTSRLPTRPQSLMSASQSPHAPASWKAKSDTYSTSAPAFLPPPLLALLHTLVDPTSSGPIDFHRPVLIPVLHALSPIFLSMYYYRLSPDLHIRIFVLPTFLTPEFLVLTRAREPRALVLLGWWFALLSLLPKQNKWFAGESVARVLQAVSNAILRTGDGVLVDAMEGAYRIVKVERERGKEAAARTIFAAWEGVHWEEGPRREEEWRREYERRGLEEVR
ncbi:hypothetical protein DPSP01_010243 [Paraphaeosphaeria sporulosa]|uniref:Zn(2)-C6 fungal-type domain-containing protein n=1 Tax=Paraphaeosphaeria sporulosa TaxID=1460663 RepID=A0A177C8I4_9PLEO|nr:uncharacterized protein CC84DRAFT_1261787 [Paraphaeosphaeria sporulosa]OAG03172.1 hypothetical protein CC84DRAFT_1261787 [Paraphaeosphaeria sporulosa]